MIENTNFNDDEIENIELGAGCGNFGKLFYPLCYLTDVDEKLKEICDKCHIDIWCNAYSIPFRDKRFKTIIMCNPYGYGFKVDIEEDENNSQKLIKELLRVLKETGEIIILASETNKYCTPNRVEKQVNTFNAQNKSGIKVKIEELDTNKEYPNFTFYQTRRKQETKPNKKIILSIDNE